MYPNNRHISIIVDMTREAIKSSKEAHLRIYKKFTWYKPFLQDFSKKNKVYTTENFA